MATINHFTISHSFSSPTLFFSSSLHLQSSHKCHYSTIFACSLMKPPRGNRKVKSNVNLCNDIREFLSSVGLPENHVPSTKELSHHGRQDLANIVRRRGYKFIRKLLETSSTQNFIGSNKDTDQTPSLSLQEKAAIFVRGATEDISFGIRNEKHDDVAYGNEGDLERVENEDEIKRLKFLLHQKELELTQLKHQIEKEKLALSMLQTKAETEISKAHKIISEIETELHAAEETLSGLKEIKFVIDGNWRVDPQRESIFPR